MNAPVHFDIDEVLREFDRNLATMEVHGDTPTGAAQLRFARTVERALHAFIVDERNRVTDHEIVADVVGAGFAKIQLMVAANYRCPCVSSRIRLRYHHTLDAIASGDCVAEVHSKVKGTEGGRA